MCYETNQNKYTMSFPIPLIFFSFYRPKFKDFIPILYFVLTHTAISKNLKQPQALTTLPSNHTSQH